MRKFLLAGAFFLVSLALPAQSNLLPHVGIFKPVNTTGNANFDPGIKAVDDTVTLILVQSGLYQIGHVESPSLPETDTTGLGALAETNRWDYLVMTRLEKADGENGSKVLFRLSVYDRAQKRVTITRTSNPVALLDLFEEVDGTAAAALGKMTGIHIGFGKLVLKNNGEPGAFSVVMDGRAVKIDELNKILNGWHGISVVQNRMKGPEVLVQTRLNIVDGTTQELDFSVPYLTYAEASALASAREKIERLWDSPDQGSQVDRAFTEYRNLFADVSYSPRLAEVRDRIGAWQEQWNAHRDNLARPSQPLGSDIKPFAFVGLTGGLVYDSKLKKPWVRDGGAELFLPVWYFYARLAVIYLASDTNTFNNGYGTYTKQVSTVFFKPGFGLNIPLSDTASFHGGIHFCFGDVPGNDGPLSAGDITAGALVNLGDHWGLNLEGGIASGCYDDNGNYWHATVRASIGYAF